MKIQRSPECDALACDTYRQLYTLLAQNAEALPPDIWLKARALHERFLLDLTLALSDKPEQ